MCIYLTKNGEKLKVGDKFILREACSGEGIQKFSYMESILTEETADVLCKLGILTKQPKKTKVDRNRAFSSFMKFVEELDGFNKERDTKNEIVNSKTPYIDLLSKIVNWKIEKTVGFLNAMYKINPKSVLQSLLYAAAICADSKYKDNIKKQNKLYYLNDRLSLCCISLTDNELNKLPYKLNDKTGYFRTREELEAALADLEFVYSNVKDLL